MWNHVTLSKIQLNTNIWVPCFNFDGCESFLWSNYTNILTLCEANVEDSVDSSNFSMLSSFINSGEFWSCCLCKRVFPFACNLPLQNSENSYLCFEQTILHFYVLFFSVFCIYHHIILWTHFLMLFHLSSSQ